MWQKRTEMWEGWCMQCVVSFAYVWMHVALPTATKVRKKKLHHTG
jgi:hypothetical protein